MAILAAGAIQHMHSFDSGIHWLLMKPWMCSIWQCTPHRTATTSPWSSKLLAFDVYYFMIAFLFVAHT